MVCGLEKQATRLVGVVDVIIRLHQTVIKVHLGRDYDFGVICIFYLGKINCWVINDKVMLIDSNEVSFLGFKQEVIVVIL